VKYYDWNEAKNEKLKSERELCFEDIVVAINEGFLIDVLVHANTAKYPNQMIYVIKLAGYVYLVPFVEDDTKIFLKTIYPSRKLTKHYLKGEK